MRTHFACWSLALAATVIAPTAVGQDASPYPPCDRTPSDAEVAAAKGAFQAGNASFNEADYARAITYWEDAYRRDCTAHPLLLNLARAYELDNQRKRAVGALETYVERNPGSADEDQIQRRIEKLREQIDKEAVETEPDPEPEPIAPPPASEEPSEPPPDPSGSRPIWPLFVAGGGLVLSGVGWAVYGIASADVQEVIDACGEDRDCTELGARGQRLVEDGNSARTRQTLGVVMGVGGGVIFAAGLVYYFVSSPGSGSGDAKATMPELAGSRIDPWIGPETAGLSLSGTF